MKRIVILCCVLFVALAGCQEDDQLTEQEKIKILLTKSWEVGYVQLEGTDITDFGYSLMQLEFIDDGKWTSVNANGLFAPSGTWILDEGGDGVNLLTLTLNSKPVSIQLNPEGSTLTMRFQRDGSEIIGGRSLQTGGEYEIYWIPKFIPRIE